MKNKKIKILFIGDIFGFPGIKILEKFLPSLKTKYHFDMIIAQAENVSGRKGFNKNDYQKLKEMGVNHFTIGNHVWANEEILEFINNNDISRPANISNSYPGMGSRIVKIKNKTIRITSLMGITFNKLLSPWKEEYADNFFDCIDNIINYQEKTDFHFVDFHAETTSEKNVLGLYLDGKVDALVGTHTHVQTNDARLLPKFTCYITDVGMCGPLNSAIGANFDEVYQKMRYQKNAKFKISPNKSQFNAVLLTLNTINKMKNKIQTINLLEN
ncbi:TIGR00282 family metallophosphoesterase [Mycoplasma sp. 744]|uniref:TIGR00282 family metallophosphoesterase n=1 Tax=Mycoplasma sp. 744 TaxID=3108531 RepID=UPI002B1DB3CD|nr:TIGR00282 family metallophosphoesterase [Mycoplasma sp. 744]MEA4115683.1 TIGR00282 family metallophosphoesterase [Mycoplasma sp. 744]